MENLTLEKLPKAFELLSIEISEIKRLLIENNYQNLAEPDQWFDLTELCNYLPDKPAKPTVYGWVHTGLIPCHKGQKKLRFLKSEIDLWLMEGRKKTFLETSKEAEKHLRKN